MGFRKQRLSIDEAKGIDMVDYLSRLGYQPAKIRNVDYLYCSPFKNEKTPSFKINRKLNCWYDHGPGNGGAILDFGIQFYGCIISEFLQKLNCRFLFTSQWFRRQRQKKAKTNSPYFRAKNFPLFPYCATWNKERFRLILPGSFAVRSVLNWRINSALVPALKMIPVVMKSLNSISNRAVLQKMSPR